ncbi:unnamed protein product [Dibothriocephalus latus]|uniref:Uncharacterized protein n=1 Tax=Dibothriocephalus latus TaxID=60516 RepID=A0A3P7KZ10_DIBLA|nr:unnamed protein product [Dibothriocephalus latus]
MDVFCPEFGVYAEDCQRRVLQNCFSYESRRRIVHWRSIFFLEHVTFEDKKGHKPRFEELDALRSLEILVGLVILIAVDGVESQYNLERGK